MKPVFVPGNRLTLLNSGGEYFPALLAAIDGAAASVHLETYIFEADRTGRAVARALTRASRRGVVVRVLVDGFGGGAFATTLMPELRANGVHAMLYQPELFRPGLNQGRLRRLHRKMAVIDERVAFVGGINVIDDLDLPTPGLAPRFDFAVRVEGPLAAFAQRAMTRLWQAVGNLNVRHRLKTPRRTEKSDPAVGEDTAAIVIRDNFRHRRDIEEAYLHALRGARRDVLVASAYFFPGRRFHQALIGAAARGVTVRVLLEGRAEYPLAYYATQSLYGELLRGGVRIFEYKRSFLHAKVAVIDDDWATVGSSNIDPFSLLLAQEANIITRSPAFTAQLRTALDDALARGADELNPEGWAHANASVRLLRFGSYQVARFLLGAAGFGGEGVPEAGSPPPGSAAEHPPEGVAHADDALPGDHAGAEHDPESPGPGGGETLGEGHDGGPDEE